MPVLGGALDQGSFFVGRGEVLKIRMDRVFFGSNTSAAKVFQTSCFEHLEKPDRAYSTAHFLFQLCSSYTYSTCPGMLEVRAYSPQKRKRASAVM